MDFQYRDNKFWQNVAEKFHEQLLGDIDLRGFFSRRTASEAEMINFNILRAGFGEDSQYYEEAIREAHRDRGITADNVTRFVAILRSVLNESGLELNEVELMISRISSWGTIIVQINN